MAKGIYIGIGSKARKIKKGYIGIGSKARKIKKGYIGIGSKARLFFSAGVGSGIYQLKYDTYTGAGDANLTQNLVRADSNNLNMELSSITVPRRYKIVACTAEQFFVKTYTTKDTFRYQQLLSIDPITGAIFRTCTYESNPDIYKPTRISGRNIITELCISGGTPDGIYGSAFEKGYPLERIERSRIIKYDKRSLTILVDSLIEPNQNGFFNVHVGGPTNIAPVYRSDPNYNDSYTGEGTDEYLLSAAAIRRVLAHYGGWNSIGRFIYDYLNGFYYSHHPEKDAATLNQRHYRRIKIDFNTLADISMSDVIDNQNYTNGIHYSRIHTVKG